jgi:electron transport complex protein RnfD
MWLISGCAGAAVIQSALGDSFASLVIALASVTAAVATELLLTHKRGWVIKDGSAVASALILALLLPNTIHPVFAALGAVFAMAVIKHGFGGLGSNWLNPALGGWLFIRFSWPRALAEALRNSPLTVLAESLAQGVSDPQGAPMAILKIRGWTGGAFDGMFTSLLNRTIFAVNGTELPSGYIELFVSSGTGIIADRCLFMLLLGTIVITAFGVNRFLIPLIYLGVYAALIRWFGALPFGGLRWGGDVLFGFCTGGTVAAAFLLAADPPSGAKSLPGSCFCAALAGIFSVLFRYGGLEPYGAFFAVALVNALTPLIRIMERRVLYTQTGRSP